ncbi:fungal-specific transcription factor domain-containing protein [Mycena amicta]|nr:fungal-specific transcription factor domain-containing protein [Mycena amicta]
MAKDKDDKPRKKPGRVPTSCAECRRLKLRCDKNVPCGKCVARGCGAICPDGQLASGKGHRLVLANTEELHDRIVTLTSRIRELEDGLRSLNESCTDLPHPLLSAQLLQIKHTPSPHSRENTSQFPDNTASGSSSASPPSDADSSQGRTGEENLIDAFGTLTIGPHGDSSFIGQTARSEYLLSAQVKPMTRNIGSAFPTPTPRLPKRITDLSFPDCEVADSELAREVFQFLPPLSEAIRLCDTYLEHGGYLPFTLQRKELLDDVLDAVYRAGSFATMRTHHSLSLMFSVFAIAALLDPQKPAYSVEAQEFFYLARASLALSSPVRETTLAAVQALLHMAQYVDLSDWEGDTASTNAAWLYLGTAVRLSFGLGLHLNSSRWKLSEEASQRRSRVFWQLFINDTWMSFSLGRPTTISPAHIDSPCPTDPPEVTAEDHGKGLSFFAWTCKYSMLMHNVVSSAFSTKPPAYNTILELDRKIRDFFIPTDLRPICGVENPPPPNYIYMQRFLVLQMKEATLLNLHRAYFVQALTEKPDDLASHRFIPSVMAAYRSAWRLIRGLVILWRDNPHLLTRMGSVWSPALSAGIVMCMLLVRSPTSKMASSSLEELDALAQLFQDASGTCRFAAQMLQPVLLLHRKAQQAVDASVPHLYPNDPCSVTPADLDRLGGRTHLIAATSDTSSTSGSSPSPSIGSRGTSSTRDSPRDIANFSDVVASSGSSIGTPNSNGVSAGGDLPMHPTIAEDMRSFDLGEPSLFYGAAFAPPEEMSGVQFNGLGVSSFGAPGGFGSGAGFNLGVGAFQNFGTATPPILDATWQSFVEQLGF